MSQEPHCAIAVVGIDIGKNSFHVVGHDQRGAIVLRQKWSRGQVEARLANLSPCLIGMEACVGAHHLSRKLQALGHQARLMPAKYVRPYSKGQKNDFRDAEAIAEAVQRPTMKFVATKTADQLDVQALHRVRERLVSQRTGIINQIRAFLLERGVAVRQGLHFLRAELPGILATRTDVLSPRMVRILEDLSADWRRLDARIEGLTGEIETLARQDQHCERLMSVPGIGPIISSAMVAAIGTGDVFSKGRDFGAWLGLVPKQISTGDRTILGSISRRGNRYLRALFVQAAWVVLVKLGPKAVGTLWAQILDRGGEEATAPQRARHCAGQQACPHRVGGSQQGARLHVRQDRCDGVPSSVILAPCSAPSRAAWQARKRGARPAQRPPLTAPVRGASARAGRDEGTAARHEQRNSAGKMRSYR
jgi:transposase